MKHGYIGGIKKRSWGNDTKLIFYHLRVCVQLMMFVFFLTLLSHSLFSSSYEIKTLLKKIWNKPDLLPDHWSTSHTVCFWIIQIKATLKWYDCSIAKTIKRTLRLWMSPHFEILNLYPCTSWAHRYNQHLSKRNKNNLFIDPSIFHRVLQTLHTQIWQRHAVFALTGNYSETFSTVCFYSFIHLAENKRTLLFFSSCFDDSLFTTQPQNCKRTDYKCFL